MEKLKKIRLRAKEERRFKQGHPWVFSNELQESPKALTPGEVVELHDAGGAFLAFGIGNPSSLIAFRELTRESDPASFDRGYIDSRFFFSRITDALQFRKSWFGMDQSFRLIHGESDGLSGLIIDRFASPSGVVYVVQPHSAGMDRNLDAILEALDHLGEESPRRIAVLRRDAGSRKLEGIESQALQVIDLDTGSEVGDPSFLEAFSFRVPGIMGTSIDLSADLAGGQKTGFFFDQLQNIRMLETMLLRKLRNDRTDAGYGSRPFRMLDLCSYVGQWSTHLLQTLSEREALPADLTCVDSSAPALVIAEKNIKAAAAKFGVSDSVTVETLKADVLGGIEGVEEGAFDLVIADPPAFIKNRKSIPQGKQAYVQLFESAIRKTRQGGLVVCCSCSQLLSQEDFMDVLAKASRRSGKPVRWLLEGSPSFDHPTRMEFREGRYLKCMIAQVGITSSGL